MTSSESNRVYGVVFEITCNDRAALDNAEGLGKGYRAEHVMVITSSGDMVAVAYVATKKEPALRPYHWYKALVIAGAVEHALPKPYVEWLRTVSSISDPNVSRRAKEEAWLFDS